MFQWLQDTFKINIIENHWRYFHCRQSCIVSAKLSADKHFISPPSSSLKCRPKVSLVTKVLGFVLLKSGVSCCGSSWRKKSPLWSRQNRRDFPLNLFSRSASDVWKFLVLFCEKILKSDQLFGLNFLPVRVSLCLSSTCSELPDLCDALGISEGRGASQQQQQKLDFHRVQPLRIKVQVLVCVSPSNRCLSGRVGLRGREEGGIH